MTGPNIPSDSTPSLEHHFQRLREERAFFSGAPVRFFLAWKKAAELAGPQYFGDGTKENLGRASAKNDLRPDLDMMGRAIGVVSPGEGVFLAVLYSFYNDTDAVPLLKMAGVEGMADIASRLDLQRRQLVADLLVNYTGW